MGGVNMPKCLECGVELPRLQWTHFKYKCTGRFNNGTEYLKIYPHAKLVDDDIAKSTAVTLENLIAKYGGEEGTTRWESYRNKQAMSNSFEYKRDKHGWTKEEFYKFNKSRAVTLDNMVAKYGEKEGTERYYDYCERQAYTTTEEYFVKTYGLDDGARRFANFTRARVKGATNNSISQVEQELYDTIKHLSQDMVQQFILEHDNNRSKGYDIASVSNRKIIEFNGTYWHCDPRFYDADYVNTQIGLTASEVWERDANKRNIAMNNGYEVFVVWESDWRLNKYEVIRRITEWWYGNKKDSCCQD